jgi:hypothetical protein
MKRQTVQNKIPLVIPRDVSVVVDTSSHTSVQDIIRRRAYEIFEARGGQSGHEVEDWLKAEREINQHLGIQ